MNEKNWPALGRFVDDDVHHNDRLVGLAGYRAMLERDYRQIPDLVFTIQLVVAAAPYVASRLSFDCTPAQDFLGLPVNGRRVGFTENVFYEFRADKIIKVWSVIDKAAVEAQL